MKKNYGIPYKGSKNRIAEDIIDFLPSGKTLVDLFGGGGAITDCASRSGKWETVIYNEIDKLPHDCFLKALKGEFDDESRWISRDDFFRLKDTDCYVACCFSFGNNFRDYLYSKENEPLKKKCHEAIFNKSDYKKPDDERLQNIERLHRLQSLKRIRVENIERLKRIQSLKTETIDNILFYNTDYRNVPIPTGSIIYCDIPYRDTNNYNKSKAFDYDAFYQWCVDKANEGFEVYVSEYDIPDDRFVEVWQKEKQCSFCRTQNNKTIEKIFTLKIS